jgi:hypothetical protein
MSYKILASFVTCLLVMSTGANASQLCSNIENKFSNNSNLGDSLGLRSMILKVDSELAPAAKRMHIERDHMSGSDKPDEDYGLEDNYWIYQLSYLVNSEASCPASTVSGLWDNNSFFHRGTVYEISQALYACVQILKAEGCPK